MPISKLIFILFLAFSFNSYAQDSLPNWAKDGDEDSITQKKNLEEYLNKIESDLKLNIERSDYLVQSLHHRQDTFEWQLWASKVIFWVVIIIVATGLFISFLQFYNATFIAKKRKTDPLDVTEFELKLEGIKVKSSLIGFLILSLSIAFFYMYLVYVFPIQEINLDQKANQEINKKLK